MQANPVGEQVVAGAAGFERVGGALTITQGTDRAVINWNSFSIGAGEITKFVQPNSSSAVLNRVITANNPSAIYGTLQANGQVYLINPAGIFIGPGGLVDTAGFVASTHDVGDKEFMAGGDLNFTGSSGASIINQGRIEAKQGDVFLVARQVSNEGQIMASDGTVGMISGTEVCLHSIGPNNYKVRLIDVANDAGVKKTDNGIADVVNAGVIEAANAELESTGNYLSLAIKNTGVIRATGVVPNADGTVTLTGGEGDILNTGVVAAIQKNIQGETVGGRILASAKNITTDPGSIMTAAGTEKGGEIRLAAKDTVYASGKVEAGSTAGKGGKVQVTGERVALIQAEVDVSGKTGGGTVLVGGDYLGMNPEVPNAKAVVMTSDSVIRANATENGDGGKVILWSDEYTGFYGEIFARGGIESGNGGFVETSSKDNLQAFGTVISSAVNGQGGLWLLDPANVDIFLADSNGSFNSGAPNVFTPNNTGSATVNRTTIQNSLNAGTSVQIQTGTSSAGQPGNITMSAGISKDATAAGTASTLTMIAAGLINISQAIGSIDGALNLTLGAGSNVTIGAAITTNGGNLTIQGSNAAGSATATSAGSVTFGNLGTVNTGTSGNLSIVASGAISQPAGTLAIGGTTTITTGGATISLTQANNFVGAVSLTNTGNNAVAVTDINTITLGASSVGTGTLTVIANAGILQSGGGITQSGAGAVTFNAGAGAITLDQESNDFKGAVSLSNTGNNAVQVTDSNALILGTSSVGATGTGNLAVTVGGALTQTGVLTVTGATTLTATAPNTDIDLSTQANSLTGSVTIGGEASNVRDFKLRNTSATAGTVVNLGNSTSNLQDLTITYNSAGYVVPTFTTVTSLRNIAITAGGAITQAAGGIVQGSSATTASFTTGAFGITLTQTANDFKGAVSLSNTGSFAVQVTDANALILGTSSVGATGTGNLAVTVGDALTQSGVLTVTGTTTLTATAPNTDIDLSTQANSLRGSVTIGGTASRVRDFKLRNTSALAGAVVNLGNLTTTSLRDLTITYNSAAYRVPTFTTVSSLRNIAITAGVTAGGGITQATGGIKQLTPAPGETAPTASFTTGAFGITLDQTANDFTGAVSLTNTGNNAVALTDANALILGTLSVGTGTLTVNANAGITQDELTTITQTAGAGTATFNAGAGVITLVGTGNNNFTGAVSLNNSGANAVAVTDVSALILGASTIGGDFDIITGAGGTTGGLTQTGALTVGGTTTLTSSTGETDIDLSTQANILTEPVSIGGEASNVRDFKLRNTSALAGAVGNLGNATTTNLRDLTITYNSAAYQVPTFTTVTSLRNIAITAGGAITQAGITPEGIVQGVSGTASFTAGANGISLTKITNDFLGVVTLSNTGTANDVAVTDANALILGTSTIGGDFDIITGAGGTTGGLTQTGILTVGGSTSLTSSAGSTDIDLSTQANSLKGSVTIVNIPLTTPTLASNVRDFKLRNTSALAGAVVNLGNATANLRDLTITYNSAAYEVPTFTTVTSLRNIAITAGGAITQAAGGIVQGSSATTASFTTKAFGITLTEAANDFKEAVVSLTNTGNNAVALTDANALILGTLSVGTGTLTVNANADPLQTGGITQDELTTITQTAGAGTATFNAGAGVITLDQEANNFTGAVSLNNTGANNAVAVTDVSALILGTSSIAEGNLAIITGAGGTTGGLTQTTGALTVGGTTTLTSSAEATDIDLSTQANTLTGAVTIGGTASNVRDFKLRNTSALAGAVGNLGNSTTMNLRDLTITYNNAAYEVPTFTTVTSLRNIAITAGVTAGGGITQAAGGIVQGSSATTASFTTGAFGIDLTAINNDFKGAVVSLINTGAGTVAVTDANALILGASSVGAGTLTVTSLGTSTATAGITQTGAITQEALAGATTFNGGAGVITLTQANDFTGAVSLNNTGVNAVAVTDRSALILGTSSIAGGNLAIITGALGATGGLTQTTGALTVGGTTTLTSSAASTDIDLSTQANVLTGPVSIGGTASNVRDFKLRNTSAVAGAVVGLGNLTTETTKLRDLTITYNSAAYEIPTLKMASLRNIAITAGGAITQAVETLPLLGGIVQGSSATTASFTTEAFGITLTQTANDFTGAVSLNNSGANAVAVTDANALILGTSFIAGGNLAIITGAGTVTGGLTQTTGALRVGGTTTLTSSAAATDIDLSTAANELTGSVTISGTASNVRDFKLRNISGAAGAVVNLGNATTTNLRDLTITYNSAAYQVPTFTTVTSLRNIAITAGGAITQAAGGIVQGSSATTASFTTGAFGITLTDTSNNFIGAVSLTNTGNNPVAVTDANALILGTSSVGATGTGNLAVTVGGALTQSGVLTVTGTTTLTATAPSTDIDLSTQANVLTGPVSIGGTASNVRDFKLRNTSAVAGAVVNLGNSTTTNLRDLTITYNSAAYEVPTFTTVTSLRNIAITAGVTAGGGITQAAGGIVQGSSATAASFTTGAFGITLTDTSNNFIGAVRLINTGVNAVAVTDANALILGTSSVGSGTLLVNAVRITQSGAITQEALAGAATFNGGAGVITLTQNNDFTGAVSLNNSGANAVAVTDANALILGTSSIAGGNLAIITGAGGATGGLTQTTGALTVGGTTTLTSSAAATDINLSTQANSLTGSVTIGGTASRVRDFKLRNTSAVAGAVVNLGNATTTNLRDLTITYDSAAYEVPTFTTVTSLSNIAITAGGAITQAAGGIVQGVSATTASFTTRAFGITLTQTANDFKAAVVSLINTGVNAVAVTDANALILGASSVGAGTLTVTSLGTSTPAAGITQSGAITQEALAGAATFNGGAGVITLTQIANDFTGAVSLNNSGANAVAVTDANALILGTSSIAGGDLAIITGAGTVTGGLTQTTGALRVGGTTTLTSSAAATDIDLSTAVNELTGSVTISGAASNVRDFKLRNISGSAGAVVNLGNLTTTNLRDLTITYNSAAYEVPTFTTVTSLRNIAITAGVTAGGGITQAAGGIVQGVSATTASFTTGAFGITLTDTSNNFIGAGGVSLNNSGANAVAVTDDNALILGTSSVGSGTLLVNAVRITQSGAITQEALAGAATFNGGAGVITLTQANDFTGAVNLNNTGANAVAVTDANALTLSTLSITAGSLTALSTGALNLGQGTVGGSLAATSNGGDISQTGGLTMGVSTFNAGAGLVTMTAGLGGAAQNSFGGAVTLAAGNADFYMAADPTGVDRLALTAGSTVVAGTFTLRSPFNTDFNLAESAGAFKLTPVQLANMNVGTLAARASGTGNLLVGTFNPAGVNALNLITAGTGNITADSITVGSLGLTSGGTVAFTQPNQVRNLGTLVVGSGGLTFQNQNGLNLTGSASMPGRLSLEVAGQFYNQTGAESPLAGVQLGSVIKSLSLMGGLPNSVSGLAGFSYRYDGVMPTAGNVMTFAVSPLALFAPNGTVIAGVDLGGTDTGGGQLNTFLTGSNDLNWIVSDFQELSQPKVRSAGLEYTIYPKRVESETRTLPDSTLSQLKQELGRPPTIDEINRREVSMRQSNRLRSGSILESSSLDSSEEPVENAKAATPSPIEGQIPQANQGPEKVVPTGNSSLELAPPVASSRVLPDDSFQSKADERAAVSELLVKERANAEVGLAIPVARSK